MKKAILILLSVYISLIVFMPKEEILYTALNTLQKQRVNFEIEDIKDYGLFEDIKGVTVIYDKMRVAKADEVRFFPFIVYNFVLVSNLEAEEDFKSMINAVLLDAKISYTIFSPKKVSISAKTTIGDIKGDFDISSSKIKLVLTPNAGFKRFKYKRYFRKTKGGYVYESVVK